MLSEEDGLPVVGATIIVEDPSNILPSNTKMIQYPPHSWQMFRQKKVSGYKVLFIYDEISSYTSTGKVEKATVDEALKVIIGKNPLKYHIDGQFINITQKDSKKNFIPRYFFKTFKNRG